MNEILSDLGQKKSRPSKFLFYAAAVFCVVILGIYVGNIFFGNRSLEVMLDLYSQRATIKNEVENLKTTNATLQKEYFELIGLEPTYDK